jgi:diguanylate cyclase (GGDEF)-like protein/PAS domain S-box-containing protein
MKRLFRTTIEQLIHPIASKGAIHPQIYDHLNAVIKLDTDGNLVSYNHAFAKQYGYIEQDFTKPFLDVFIKYETIVEKHFFEKALLGMRQKFNALGRCKNGKTIDINVTLIPIKTNAGMDIYVIVKNITEYKAQEEELLRFKKHQDTFNALENICHFYYDAIKDHHYFSKQFPVIFGIDGRKKDSPTLNHLLQYVHSDDRNRVKNTIEKSLSERTGYQLEYRLLRRDKTVRYLNEHGEILLDKKGNLDGLIGFIQDITSCKLSDHVSEKEKQLNQLYSNPDIGIWSTNVQSGQCLNSSKGSEKISGYSTEEFNSGLLWTSIIHPEDLPHYLEGQQKLEAGNILHHQYRIIHKNGDIRWVQEYAIPTLDADGKLIQLNGLSTDITEQKVLNEKVKYLSDYDYLTKLPNRQKFYEKLQQLTDEYAKSNQKFAIMIFDMDRFKYVNDTLGHQIGDELLIQISERLSTHLTSDDMLSRHGGDEFIVLIGKMGSIESLKEKADQMIESLKEPFYIKDFQLYVTASVGISTYPYNGVSSIELLRNADLALYNSQKSGKNNYKIISHSSSIQSYKAFSIGRDLKKAIKNNEMTLFYQPRVDAHSNQIISAEALIRWNHPEWGIISPHEFLTIAEEIGLITEIDDWVLKEVCNQIKRWKIEQQQTVPISINISAVHFMKPDWPSTVAKVIREADIHPGDLEFEITESLLLNNKKMVKNTIDSLKELGIKIALDDFGTGYSSLSYLTQFPFDVIKIDKSFIRNMDQSDRDLFIAKSIIYMAKGLQIKVVAEGVETIQQLEILQKEQCDEIQGYLFSHPVPTDEFKPILQKKTLPPMDPKLKAKQNKRKHDRLHFPYPLAADMRLISIAGRSMQLGKSNVLIEDMSIGGLRYVSNLRLPVRGDVQFEFKTEILGKPLQLNGSIVWKEEINEDLIEYGIKFIMGEDEQTSLASLLDTFNELLKNSTSLPPYKLVKEDKYQYFKQLNSDQT